MVKEMIVSSSDHETRVAILEDDEIVELFIERERQRGVVGNVYKGRVSKVLPGMQSAFVDLGLERDGFLYVSDVVSTLDALDPDDDEAGDGGETSVEQATREEAALALIEAGGPGVSSAEALLEDAAQADETPDGVEDTPAAPIALLPPHVDPVEKSGGSRDRRDRGKRRPEPPLATRIEDLLREGQEVIVQVVKEPLGTKGARLTCHVTIPGRFLVFMPTVDHLGVSRKIEAREERGRLRGIVRRFREEHGFNAGVIIRTAAAGRPDEDILGDLRLFLDVWQDIRRRSESSRAPAVVYREQSLVAKLLRDLLSEDYATIRIDNPLEHRRTLDFVSRVMPAMAPRVRLYAKKFPIFDEYGVQSEIDKALRSKMWLKSGGYIVINQTEALVAIDVNTGRYVGKKSAGRLEDTIVKTNLEAVQEIVRQIRLRDLGGIIVLDFIDMEDRKNRQKVAQAVEQELRRDRAPSKAVQVSDFGLIIVTRKRVKQSLERQLTEPCPYCTGTGTIKSSATICFEILTEVQRSARDLNGHGVLLRVNPDIAAALTGPELPLLKDAESAVGRRITLKPDPFLHHEQFDVMAL